MKRIFSCCSILLSFLFTTFVTAHEVLPVEVHKPTLWIAGSDGITRIKAGSSEVPIFIPTSDKATAIGVNQSAGIV